MTIYKPGQIVLVTFPFTTGSTAKNRPALVLVDHGDNDFLLARITTQPHSTATDCPIQDWRGAGLLAPSIARLCKLATLDKSLVKRVIGALQPGDKLAAKAMLQSLFNSW
ncbi:MAG: type II toxin-antitoxin system PemK/MazF family toxin [Pirellulaceae bacterium]